MRFLFGALLALFVPMSMTAQEASNTLTIGLEDAVQRSVAVAPRVLLAEGGVYSAEGQRAQATWPFASNPTIEYERIRRRSGGPEVYDFGWRFSQQVEITGQSRLRRDAANRRIESARALVSDAGRRSGLEARLAYLELHLAERREALADSNAEFAEQLSAIAQRQLDAGEINMLVYNTAILEAARARSQAERFAGRRRAVGAFLGSLLALPPDSLVTTSPLPALPVLPTTSRELEADVAFDRRPDLVAATMELEAADRVFGAERRRFVPNLELALFTGQEGETDDLFGFSLGLSVPLFRRGQSARGSARSDQAAAEAVSRGTIRAIRAEVTAGLATYAGASTAERRFADDLLGFGAENAELAARAFAEGELSITEVVVFRTAALATQLEYVEVLADAYAAWFELAAAYAATPQELTELLGGA